MRKIFRASILNPIDVNTWRFYRDGALWVDHGVIMGLDDFCVIAGQMGANPDIEHLDGVIVPGFVDVHLHWVQHRVSGQFSGDLLTWLQEHIWPEEACYADTDLARVAAVRFYADLLRAGTVMGMSYSSPHAEATQIALASMRGDWVVGNVLMAVHAPHTLTDHSLHDPGALRAFLQRTDMAHYALTPRFAPNLTAKSLKMLGRVAAEHPCLIQTHLAESLTELRWVKELFPDAAHYTEVYDRAGLLTPRTILGHCVEMRDEEWRCVRARGAWVAHCPTSNEALGNRRMPLEQLRAHHIPFALASDIGGGPSHSMLHVMQRFLGVHRDAGVPVTPQEALYRSTKAGAECMGRGASGGELTVGKRADFVLLPQKSAADSVEAWFEACLSGAPADLEHRPLGTWLSGERAA
ncbi:amidohydrolase family protein [Acidithiobacillus ferrianus]|uniref:Amidohydrolase family protein n=2 Tax=Acidithiobacillus ferrianus TaxID=2678518 RepID=A0A845U155_9PROT|nr:amidohydrolase family protein [Acidithiobacillus ferrianus]NDU41312.1 amidohydrolase family protein [Acidithiobacillus ferrianus]